MGRDEAGLVHRPLPERVTRSSETPNLISYGLRVGRGTRLEEGTSLPSILNGTTTPFASRARVSQTLLGSGRDTHFLGTSNALVSVHATEWQGASGRWAELPLDLVRPPIGFRLRGSA